MYAEEEEILRRLVNNTVAEVESQNGKLSPYQLSSLLFSLLFTCVDGDTYTDEQILYLVRSACAFKRQREGVPARA